MTQEMLNPDQIKELLKDPTYLPTTAEVLQAFPKSDDSHGFSSGWREFCGKNHIYQLLTQEMIDDLTTKLVNEINEMLRGDAATATPVTVLELGAGDGRLAHFIREELKKRQLDDAIRVVATDNGSWKTEDKIAHTEFEVEVLSAEAAVEKYAVEGRTILLSSWMPGGVNWTDLFLQQEKVKGMLLIGDIGSTGMENDTWYPHEYETDLFTDDIRGNFGRAQGSPNNDFNQSTFAYIAKSSHRPEADSSSTNYWS